MVVSNDEIKLSDIYYRDQMMTHNLTETCKNETTDSGNTQNQCK